MNRLGKYHSAAPAVVKASVAFLVLLFAVALLAPVISNDKPVYLSYEGYHFFPALSGKEFGDIILYENQATERIMFSETDWNKVEGATVIQPLFRYAPHKSDFANSGYKSPFDEQVKMIQDGQTKVLTGREKHLLGTGKRGEDLLAGLIYGTRVSLSVGLMSMAIAGLIGIFLGAVAGYYGDEKLKTRNGSLIMLLIGTLPAWFYAFTIRHEQLVAALNRTLLHFSWELFQSLIIFCAILFVFYLIGRIISFAPFFRNKIYFPLDAFISRIIEILISLPRLMLIISIAAISKPSLANLVLIIGLTSWTEIARFTRAEMLKLRQVEFVQAARSMGFRELRTIFRHVVPNALGPAMVAIAFGIASAILVESGLSFLGIGVPQDIVTWGSLLASGRENFSAWWLVIFPGLAIFMTVTAYNVIGEWMRDMMDPKEVKNLR